MNKNSQQRFLERNPDYNIRRKDKNVEALREKQKVWQRKNRAENPEKIKAYNEKYRLSPEVQIRQKAVNKLNWAVKSGKVFKPTECRSCGRKPRLQAHHYSYDKPYEVVWLCSKCHGFLHFYLDQIHKAFEGGV